MRLARGCALRERELLQQMLHLPIRLHRAQTPMLVPEMPLGDDFKLRSDDAGGKGRARLQGCRRDQGVLDEREREPCRGKSNNRTTMKHDQENQDTAAPCQALAPQPCSALVAALTAGSEHCARLIRERPAAPMQPTWALLRDLLNDMRYAAEKSGNAKGDSR